MAAIRVVLAEDNDLLREGIARLVEGREDLNLIGVASGLPQLLTLVQEQAPDVVVTDIRMPPTGTDEGIQAAERVRQVSPQTGVLVLSQYSDPEYALALLDKGAAGRGYLLKERVSDLAQLRDAIHEVARGGSVIDPRVIEALVAARSRPHESALTELTPRELEVLGQVAQGKNNAAIAASLFLTERAVEKHINSIFSKLGLSEDHDVNRRVKATLLYLSETKPAS